MKTNQRTTQRASTRQDLLEASARMFAEHGVSGCSVTDVATAAGRTTGAIYDHFESKQGLVFALVDEWLDDNAATTIAMMAAADGVDQRLAALWRGTNDESAGDGRWLTLEVELWTCAQRDAEIKVRLRERFRRLWDGLESLAEEWPDLVELRGKAPVVMGVLTGLYLMRQVDPDAFTDEAAVAALRAVVMSDTRGES